MIKLNELHPTTRKLVLARAIRSIGQGILVVDLTLYLSALGWNGFHIGLLLSSAGLFGALLSLGVGIASDRLRRKPFLIIYEGFVLAAAGVVFFTAQHFLLSVAVVIAGFGRGANGAAGPFSPVEQAWLAEAVQPSRRGRVYSLNSAFGFFGMGFGALLAMLPEWFSQWIEKGNAEVVVHAVAYRPLFLIVAISSIANIFILLKARENYSGAKKPKIIARDQSELIIRKKENKKLTGLVVLNSFNGMAVGLTGPLISYWFATKFGIGPASIAPIMAATFFITGLSSVLTGRISEKIGLVKSIVWARLVGLVLLILLPLMPYYWLASLVYILRSAFNRGSIGNRQALTVGLVREERRGFATSLNAVSMQLPQSVGPGVSGFLFNAGELQLPFYAGAVLQGVYLVLYNRFFRNENLTKDDD